MSTSPADGDTQHDDTQQAAVVPEDYRLPFCLPAFCYIVIALYGFMSSGSKKNG